MKKTYCDICEREINTPMIVRELESAKTDVIIYHERRTLDICDACRNKIVRYVFKDMRGMVDLANL